MRTVTGAARIFTRRCKKRNNLVGNHSGAKNVNNFTTRTTTSKTTINGTTTRPKSSTTFHRPIGCHISSSYLGHNSTTSLLSIAGPSMVTCSLDCDDEDDIDGT